MYNLKSCAFLWVLQIIYVYRVYGYSQTYEEMVKALPERPNYNNKYLNEPGMKFEPNLESSEELVFFERRNDNKTSPYINRLNSVLQKYDLDAQQSNSRLVDCSTFTEYMPIEDMFNVSCRFGYRWLFEGRSCSKESNYGFDYGKPCFLLSLDRILNWLPEPYNATEVPEKILHLWTKYSITVHCEGEDPVSRDNLGPINYFPSDGLHFKYFPQTTVGWIGPVVFVELERPMIAIAMRVTCTAYAKNIMHADTLNTGKVSFDVLID